MAYSIEVMSVGSDIYAVLHRAVGILNGIQDQFRFFLTPVDQRLDGTTFSRADYKTEEVFDFLRLQRTKYGGNRPYIVSFINAPLSSEKWHNLFGSHKAEEGLAVVTTADFRQYVKEEVRFCCYYLVRYALSFVNPHIKAHGDAERVDCYFHFKEKKNEIRASMDSGHICDDCMSRLDTPPDTDTLAKSLSASEREALQKLRSYVAGQLPGALIVKGGGVKGLAFAGALIELERYYIFDRYVGTSAGAITAALLAAKYSPQHLVTILREKDLREFLDSPIWWWPLNLLARWGLHKGDAFKTWIDDLLREKLRKEGPIQVSDLPGLRIYAAQAGRGALPFDSSTDRRETAAAFAVRCSMSIPVLFVPQLIEGHRVYDGGLRANFPVRQFLATNPHSPFIALFLSGTRGKSGSFVSDIATIFLEGEDAEVVDSHSDNVVRIDTAPVGFADFWISPIEKEFLLSAGRAAALGYLVSRNLDEGPTLAERDSAIEVANELRGRAAYAKRLRQVDQHGLLIVSLVVVAFMSRLYFGT